MAIIVMNRSNRDLYLPSIKSMLPAGGRLEFDYTYDDLLIKCREFRSYMICGSVIISEDIESVNANTLLASTGESEY